MRRLFRQAWNVGLALALNLNQRAAGVLVFIVVSRLSGPHDAGTFSLAVGYLAILATIFTGLDDILVRESVSEPNKVLPLLATYGTLRFGFSAAAWVALMAVLAALRWYSSRDMIVLAIVTGTVLIDTMSALGQSVLQAHGRFGWPLIATSVGTAIKLGGALLASVKQAGLEVSVLAWPLGSLGSAIIMTGALARHLRGRSDQAAFCFDPDMARHLGCLFPSFSATSILAGLEFQADVILISVLLSREDVALYSAAVTIMMVAQMVAQAYRMVLYPALVRALAGRPESVRALVGRSLLAMGGLALVAASGVTLIAPALVRVVYGQRFEPTAAVLQILIWNLLLFFLDVPLVRFMIATGRQSRVWQSSAVSLTANIIANLVLLPRLGIVGAAFARICSSAVFCVLIGGQVLQRLTHRQFASR